MSETVSEEPIIETPLSLLPDLTEIGIQEIDSGICEDTAENRRTLKANRFSWVPIWNSDGTPTDRIQAVSPEMADARMQRKAALLSDTSNPNSDYLTGWNLIFNDEASGLAPAWVVAATRKWNEVEERREQTGEKYWPYLQEAPGRCSAKKVDGTRCQNWHNGKAGDGTLCKMHLNRPEQQHQVLLKARNRVQSMALGAVEELENLMHKATSEPVRLKAAETILDRAGIRPGIEIDSNVSVEVRPASQTIADRLNKLAISAKSVEADEDIVDAEVVEETVSHDDE